MIETGGGGASSFGSLTGAPGDNTALATALAAKLDKAGGTMTGALINSTAGASGAPAFTLTGAVFSGGSGTTTKPLALLEPAGTTSTGWSTAGTVLGVNAPSGTSDIFAFQRAGTNKMRHDGTNDWVVFSTSDGAGRLPRWETPNGNIQFQVGGGSFLFTNCALAVDTLFQVQLAGNSAVSAPVYIGPSSGIWERRNNTTAQTDRVFNTYTSDANCEFLQLGWSTNIAHLRTAKGASGGTVRNLVLGVGSDDKVTLTPTQIILAALPTSDPGIPGALYKVGGAVMQSA